jgi:hypothetical protein
MGGFCNHDWKYIFKLIKNIIRCDKRRIIVLLYTVNMIEYNAWGINNILESNGMMVVLFVRSVRKRMGVFYFELTLTSTC